MAEQVDILDFNEAHRNRNSQNQEPDRYSARKIKQLLTLEDVDSWMEQIKLPQSRNFQFPSQLEKAIIHAQSFYIHPNKKFLKDNPKIINCDCCGQMIRRQRYNIFTCDMYAIFAGEYGISIPFYFSIIKLHFFILLTIGCIFGIYYCYLSDKYCGLLNRNNQSENALYDQYCTTLLAAQHFLLQIKQIQLQLIYSFNLLFQLIKLNFDFFLINQIYLASQLYIVLINKRSQTKIMVTRKLSIFQDISFILQ